MYKKVTYNNLIKWLKNTEKTQKMTQLHQRDLPQSAYEQEVVLSRFDVSNVNNLILKSDSKSPHPGETMWFENSL